MEFPHGSQPRYDEYGLSPREKEYLIAKQRHETAERERERLQALAEVEGEGAAGRSFSLSPKIWSVGTVCQIR
jgi:hypothetical protein